MAIFRLEVKIFSREKRGRSIVAAAAYRAGKKLRDGRSGEVHDFSRRGKGVVRTAIFAPADAPGWVKDSERLWNEVERSETRKDAQTGREFILALPKELTSAQQWEAASAWAHKELVSRGMVAEVSLHRSEEGDNVHAHILCPLRAVGSDGFSEKKPREWNSKALLMKQRESWATVHRRYTSPAAREGMPPSTSRAKDGILCNPLPAGRPRWGVRQARWPAKCAGCPPPQPPRPKGQIPLESRPRPHRPTGGAAS